MDPSSAPSATSGADARTVIGEPPRREAQTLLSHDAAVPPVVDPTHPAVIGPYRLIRVIAHGGMGIVWEAIDERLDRRVALKLLLGVRPGAQQVERFRREALHAAKLRHPNIISVHDV